MFKMKPIAQAIFEGFLQHIVSIQTQPSTELDPDFFKMPIFGLKSIEKSSSLPVTNTARSRLSDGWQVVMMQDSSSQFDLEFRADRNNQTLVTGVIERTAEDTSDVQEDIEITLPNPLGQTGSYLARIQDVEICVWVEYLPAMIDDGNGNQIEAPRSKILQYYTLNLAEWDQPTFNSRVGTLQLYLRNQDARRSNFSLPTIRGVRIHYAMQGAFVVNTINTANQQARHVNTDVAPFTLTLSPPSDILTNGLPKFEHAGQHGFVATSRTTRNLTRSSNYKGFAARALHQFEGNPQVFSVAMLASSHRIMNPDNFTVSHVQNLPSSVGEFLYQMEARSSSFGSTGSFYVERFTDAFTFQDLPGYSLDNANVSLSYISARNFVYRGGGLSFTGLPANELGQTYVFGSTVDPATTNFSFNRIQADTTQAPSVNPVTELSVNNTADTKQITVSQNGVTLLTMNHANADTTQILEVNAVNERASALNLGFNAADFAVEYNERIVGSLEFVSVNLTIDASNDVSSFDSNRARVAMGYRYIPGEFGAVTQPQLPNMTSFGEPFTPSWQVLF